MIQKDYLWRNKTITYIFICFNTNGIFKYNVLVKNSLIYCINIFTNSKLNYFTSYLIMITLFPLRIVFIIQ